ncbi:MAG: PD-(D/E)XK nuclease family protein [Paludibacteraceae bacterium]
MDSFLYSIAKVFYNEYQSDIRKFTFVFPNRRAGLFFQKYLTELIEMPIFSPEIITVNDCFFNASTRQAADRTAELFRLYRIYGKISGSEESFDSFVYWGEMLLADFNDVDKWGVDDKQLFTNVRDLKEIDMMNQYLTEEQRVAIERFWQHFLPTVDNKTKDEFITIWRILQPLYEEFRNELLSENLATEGMIFREVVELLEKNKTPEYFARKKFVFVGFNALNNSEKKLFIELQKRSQADFYWDYEAAELRDPDNQASVFFVENTRMFPSKFSIQSGLNLLKNKSFQLIAIPSSVGQTKEVYNLLKMLYSDNPDEKDWIKTAVVLPDENLLLPLLHSLPENIGNINVTMGFPLKSAPVSGLMEDIFELHRRVNSQGQFYHKTVSNILNHQYISMLCRGDSQNILQEMIDSNAFYADKELFEKNDLLRSIFTLQKSTKEFVEYLLDVLKKLSIAWQNFSEENNKYHLECDFLYQYFIAINRMKDVMFSIGEFQMNLDTLFRLIRQLIGGISIPFEGEPLNGLQVMGMLETRGLDFENLIICSFNEGVFPNKNTSNSFIPNNLRRAFGLPTADYHDDISAYNFYRLIQRTKRLFFLYDSRAEGMQTGEVSRYIHQLHYHYGVEFKQINISYDVNFPSVQQIEVQKSPEIIEKLKAFLKDGEDARALSPSSINTYIDCPLRFYLKHVEQMAEQDEVTENVEAGMFGTLLHEIMQKLYEPFVGIIVNKSELEGLRNNIPLIEKTITKAFATNFFKRNKDAELDIKLEGNYLLTARIIRKYILQILKIDIERTPFRYIQAEKNTFIQLPIQNGSISVNLKGYIDRVDEKEGVVRILDYKTGGDKLEFTSLDEVFERNKKQRPKVVLQTFLYCLLYMKDSGAISLVPEVLKVRDLFKDDFSTQLRDKMRKELVTDFNDYKEVFVEKLTLSLEEIFNPEIPFVQCSEIELCRYCRFKVICRREVKETKY